jgi:hypothetical protein
MLRKKIALEDAFPSDKMSAVSQALQDAADSFDNLSTVKAHWEKTVKPDPDYLSAANTYVCLLLTLILNLQYLFLRFKVPSLVYVVISNPKPTHHSPDITSRQPNEIKNKRKKKSSGFLVVSLQSSLTVVN